MIATEKVGIFAIMFGVAYAVLYTIATELNLPLVTYHPVIGAVDVLYQRARSPTQPAMYWYGWMLTSLVGALVIAYVATFLPESLLQRIIVCGVIGALAYLVVHTIALYVYAIASTEMELLKSRWASAIVAAVIAVVATYFAPARWSARVWHGWISVIPIGALAVLGYYLIPFFTR